MNEVRKALLAAKSTTDGIHTIEIQASTNYSWVKREEAGSRGCRYLILRCYFLEYWYRDGWQYATYVEFLDKETCKR